ncbi:GMC family oxidoreductase N-terminal domain-containing protein [Mycobacteroides immunogenum]|uniref:GMC family oxidoreductase N-terminal domain-containing protein n=1 Tax=Mycobacteroides immunogenum TaxID=83262 RepID=UPI0025B74AC7|nr:GMC family oxidoreductase N-terminal domain-containing protein [Mycobacteroides immunogenum]WJR34201.1 GMC family oxidoreductase N-terminal domain-containing protein [Mycobacteroides immunogenum]
MELSDRELAALRLIAETFAPGDDHNVPSATELGSEQLLLTMLSREPRKKEIRGLRLILRLWDSRWFGRILHGSRTPFSALSHGGRERVLLGLAESWLAFRRHLFNSLRILVLVTYYVESDAEGSSPVWRAIGYAPPKLPEPVGSGAELPVTAINSDSVIDCDVVVVGAGAGGGAAAAALAAAGLHVVVMEAGEYHPDTDFDGTEKSGLQNLYAGSPQMTAEGQLSMLEGSGVGGGTVVNYTTCFRTPERVRDEWATLGAEQFGSEEYSDALDAVWARLSVNSEYHRAAPRDAFFERGLLRLGWHAGTTARNVVGCEMGSICGRCGMGCPLGAKQSTAKTWLADATAAGAKIISGARVRTITLENGKATGVVATVSADITLAVRARAVVVAAGAIQTPALLKRSGLGNPNIGRHLRMHPLAVVWGRANYDVPPWEGSMQSRYSDHHADLDGHGYGVLYETGPMTPGLAAAGVPWRGGRHHLASMTELRHLVPVAAIVRDRDSGEVRIGSDGHPTVHYKLSARDTTHLMTGLQGAAQILEAAGATKIIGPHHVGITYQPSNAGASSFFASRSRAAGAKPGALVMGSLHLMGSARMGNNRRSSALNPDGELWECQNIVVADASCFPTATGVNPMISVQAIARMNALRLAGKLT